MKSPPGQEPLASITCKVGVDDLVRIMLSQGVDRKSMLKAAALKCVIVGVVAGYLAYSWWSDGYDDQAWLVLFGGIALIIFNLVYAAQAHGRVEAKLRQIYGAHKNHAFEYPVTYLLFDGCYEVRSEIELERTSWRAVESIDRKSGYIQFIKAAGTFTYVPERAFESEQAIQHFLNLARSRFEAIPPSQGSQITVDPQT